jgi:branched-chain amino acid transport system substrate-binding protein
VLLFFMTLAGCTGGGTIPIGFSGQLTGVHSDLGVAARNGAQLAVERVQEQGGVAGKRLELIVENDENTPEGALEADRKLIERGVVAIIGHMTSTQTLAALPMLRKEGVPLVSPTTSTPLLSGKKDNFFRLNSSSERSAAVMGKYACEQLGTQHVGVVYDTGNEAYTLPYTDTFIESARAHGAETFERIPFDSEAADSASTGDVNRQKMIERLEAAGCDTVLVVASAADTALFAQALAESALDVHLLGSGWAYTDSLLRYGGEAVEGIRFTDTFSREGGNEAFTEFARAYEERYGNEPNFAAAHGYETVYFLRKGLKRTGGKAEGLIEALSSIERLEGFTGTLKFDEYGEVYRPVFISRVENGEFNMVNKIDAVFPE